MSDTGKPAHKTWLEILGDRVDDSERAPSVISTPRPPRGNGPVNGGGNGKVRRVRFSDLDASANASRPAAAVEPTVDRGMFLEIQRQLIECEKRLAVAEERQAVAQRRCREAESRVAHLEKELAALRSRPQAPQVDTAEVESLRRRLAEAYDVISAIEQAYLEGERRRDGS